MKKGRKQLAAVLVSLALCGCSAGRTADEGTIGELESWEKKEFFGTTEPEPDTQIDIPQKTKEPEEPEGASGESTGEAETPSEEQTENAETGIEQPGQNTETPKETEAESTQSTGTGSGEKAGLTAVARVEKWVNVREHPDTASEILGKIYNNCAATIEEEVEGEDGLWYRITSGKVNGYIKAEFFVIGEEAEALKEEIGLHYARVVVENVRVRSTPELLTDSNIVSLMPMGTDMFVISHDDDWALVQTDSDNSGYVHMSCIELRTVFDVAISLEEEKEREQQQAMRKEAAKQAAKQYQELLKQQQGQEQPQETEPVEPGTNPGETPTEPDEQPVAPVKPVVTIAPTSIDLVFIGGTQYAGASLKRSDLAVVMSYSDGSFFAVEEWTCPDFDRPLTEGENHFTISCDGLSTDLAVIALPDPSQTPSSPVVETPVLTGINAVFTGGTKYAGQTVVSGEITVLALFSDGTQTPVGGWSCGLVGTPLYEGTNLYEISYGGFTTTLAVNASVFAEPEPQASTELDMALRNAIVAFALQFEGCPYVHAGNSLTQGTDCSGFTKLVYAQFGYDIARTPGGQAVQGHQISKSQIKPGDLAFYTRADGTIGHVALYIGDGRIIHAATEQYGICIWALDYREPCRIVSILD